MHKIHVVAGGVIYTTGQETSVVTWETMPDMYIRLTECFFPETVGKPTVFIYFKNVDQYIPLSLFEVQAYEKEWDFQLSWQNPDSFLVLKTTDKMGIYVTGMLVYN